MSVAIGTITNVDSTRDSFVVYGTLTLGGSYPGSAGDTLSFAGFDQIKSSSPPTWVEIMEVPPAASLGATVPSGLQYGFAPGTTQANGKMFVLAAGTSSGTIVSTSTAPTITTATGNPATAPIGVVTGALAQTAGATGITGVQAPIITSTFTGSGGGSAPLGNVTYASVHAANVRFRAEFSKFI